MHILFQTITCKVTRLHVRSDRGVAHRWTCLFVGRRFSFICFCAKCVIYCLISYTDCSYYQILQKKKRLQLLNLNYSCCNSNYNLEHQFSIMALDNCFPSRALIAATIQQYVMKPCTFSTFHTYQQFPCHACKSCGSIAIVEIENYELCHWSHLSLSITPLNPNTQV